MSADKLGGRLLAGHHRGQRREERRQRSAACASQQPGTPEGGEETAECRVCVPATGTPPVMCLQTQLSLRVPSLWRPTPIVNPDLMCGLTDLGWIQR